MRKQAQGYIIAVLTTLVLGGIGAHLTSTKDTYDLLIQISSRLAVLEEQIKYIREELDDH